MKIVEINSTNTGSTGNIAVKIAEIARQEGNEIFICCPKSRTNMTFKTENQIFIGDRVINNVHRYLGYYTGFLDCFSNISTLLFLKDLDKIKPDLIHLHNLHNCYINLALLFNYIKKRNIPVVWTLHDCWAFTGRCPHFLISGCNSWKTGCEKCKYPLDNYPAVRMNREKWMWIQKRKWFSGVKNLKLAVPSRWLAELVGESFLQNYPCVVINNGIDLDVFKPTANGFRNQHNLSSNKKLVLGVASNWGYSKGLDVFEWLSLHLPSDYTIVLVGTTKEIEENLPKGILSVSKTHNQNELAAIYSEANVFVNPTREDNFPTVNLEAMACGTPIITYNTGGASEMLAEGCGFEVEKDDKEALLKAILQVCNDNKDSKACIHNAENYSCRITFQKYLELYRDMTG